MFSQYNEDDHILKIFEDVHSGRVLDIGAWHPTDKSNSRALIERGWAAVMIEPSPGPLLNIVRACVKCGDVPIELHGERKSLACDKCGARRYGGSDQIQLIAAAVGIEPGVIPISITDDAVSTSDPANYEVWREAGGYYGRLYVPVITLEQITNQFGGFDFVSFDAEGVSVNLATRYLEIGCRPKAMIIEHDGRLVELLSATEAAGYRAVHTNGTNVLVAR